MWSVLRTLFNILMLLIVLQEATDHTTDGFLILIECSVLLFYFIGILFIGGRHAYTRWLIFILRRLTVGLLIHQIYYYISTVFSIFNITFFKQYKLTQLNISTQLLLQAFAHYEGYEYARHSLRTIVWWASSLLLILHYANTQPSTTTSINSLSRIMRTREFKIFIILYFVAAIVRHSLREVRLRSRSRRNK